MMNLFAYISVFVLVFFPFAILGLFMYYVNYLEEQEVIEQNKKHEEAMQELFLLNTRVMNMLSDRELDKSKKEKQ
jgi:hypothetical protein